MNSPFDRAPWRDGHAAREERILARWDAGSRWLLAFLLLCYFAFLLKLLNAYLHDS